MTIEQPTDIDRSEWKCYIGYAEDTNLKTIGAVLDAGDTITDPGDGECFMSYDCSACMTQCLEKMYRNYR